MNKGYSILAIIAILFIVFIWGCESASEQTTYKGNIQGIIVDSVSNIPLQGVNVTVYPGGGIAHTDSNGYYFVKDILLPRSEFSGTITAEAGGFFSKVVSFFMRHNMTNTLDTIRLVPVIYK